MNQEEMLKGLFFFLHAISIILKSLQRKQISPEARHRKASNNDVAFNFPIDHFLFNEGKKKNKQ